MITKKLKCDAKGCKESQETGVDDSFIAPGWLIRTTDDRLHLANGHMIGGAATYHFCPEHAALPDVHPRIKTEISALKTLENHGRTLD